MAPQHQAVPSVRFAVEATQPDGTDQTWYRVMAGDEVVYTSLVGGSVVTHHLMDVNARAAAAYARAADICDDDVACMYDMLVLMW